MEQTKRINNLTFLEFMDEFKGKIILNQYGKEVFKYELFYSKISIHEIKEKFNLVNRK
jgi:hypothetical protein